MARRAYDFWADTRCTRVERPERCAPARLAPFALQTPPAVGRGLGFASAGAFRPLAHVRSPLRARFLAKHPAHTPEQHKGAPRSGIGELFDLRVRAIGAELAQGDVKLPLKMQCGIAENRV